MQYKYKLVENRLFHHRRQNLYNLACFGKGLWKGNYF